MTYLPDYNYAEAEMPGGLGLLGLTGPPQPLTAEERLEAIALGREFSQTVGKDYPCLVITGPLLPLEITCRPTDSEAIKKISLSAEDRVMKSCMDVFGYPDCKKDVINVLLDSRGGSLDSAFKIIQYLHWYSDKVNLYVPRRAKSASTLLALGADQVRMSRFGELGPLDAQIPDPRNPGAYISALDCYQSVDHVRLFGLKTMSMALQRLSGDAGRQVAFSDLLETASRFAIGAVDPMLHIRALDFGAWGRSLQIGERYAKILLQARQPADEAAKTAEKLVFRYPHHLYPIYYDEACELGIIVQLMDEAVYRSSMKLVEKCGEKTFIRFVSKPESDIQLKNEEEAPAQSPWE